MDNQHRMIRGYRDLGEEEIALVNECKALGEDLDLFVRKLRNIEPVDQRWVSIGATDLQTGLMALVRSIAQPGTF